MLRVYIPQVLALDNPCERLICADVTRHRNAVFVHVFKYPDFEVRASAIDLSLGDKRRVVFAGCASSKTGHVSK